MQSRDVKGTLRNFPEIIHRRKIYTNLNPLCPYSDQHQMFLCNINAYSTPEVMRIDFNGNQTETFHFLEIETGSSNL